MELFAILFFIWKISFWVLLPFAAAAVFWLMSD